MLEERITARVPMHVKEKLQKAADIEGATLNQFIVQAALEKAVAIIERESRIQLSVEDSKAFYTAITQAALPNERLKNAVSRYQLGKIVVNDLPDKDDAKD